MAELYRIEDLQLSLPDLNRKPLFGAAPRVDILKGISFSLQRGEVLGIVGGSGSGTSTLGRAMVRLLQPTAGRVVFDGRDITHLDEPALRGLRRRFQMIFQDPMSSLNPRHRVGSAKGWGLPAPSRCGQSSFWLMRSSRALMSPAKRRC